MKQMSSQKWAKSNLAPGAKKMLLVPRESLGHLNGFLVSFLVAGVVFFGVSLLTRPGAAEKKSLGVFFHPSLD